MVFARGVVGISSFDIQYLVPNLLVACCSPAFKT